MSEYIGHSIRNYIVNRSLQRNKGNLASFKLQILEYSHRSSVSGSLRSLATEGVLFGDCNRGSSYPLISYIV